MTRARALGRVLLGPALVWAVWAWVGATAAQAEAEPSASLVFVMPSELDAGARSSLQDAVSTQLSMTDVRMVAVDPPALPAPVALEDRVERAVALAEEHHALGVLWLDVRPTDHWFLYAMDAKAERVVVRPLFVRKDSVAAGIEQVAVIARACGQALLHGEPVLSETPATPVEPRKPPPAEEKPAPPAPPPSAADAKPRPPEDRLRLALAYRGETFAHASPWQSGANLSAIWLWSSGPFVGLGFSLFPVHDFGDAVRFEVQRRPLSLLPGWRFALTRWLDLDTELAVTFDLRSRHTKQPPTGLAPRADQTQLLFALGPSVRAELEASPWLSFFAGASLDVFLNEFDYFTAPKPKAPLVRPYRARPGISVGVAILR